MNDEFPLKETSSIYMSGEQLYNIVQYDKPGFRYATTMFPVEAQEIRDVVSDALEEEERRGAIKALRDAAGAIEENNIVFDGDHYQPCNSCMSIHMDWLDYRADQMEDDDGT